MERMHSSCLVSVVQGHSGGVMVWGICFWHTLGPKVSIKDSLHEVVYIDTVSDHVP